MKLASNEIFPEYEKDLDSVKISAKLGYDGDVVKIYASIKGQLSENFKETEIVNSSVKESIEDLF